MLPYVICVEGNIGSGKSTLLTNLGKSGFTVIEEPVNDIWGQYLPQLYDDIKRWGFCFQMEAMDWFRQLQSRKFAQILIRMKEQNGGKSLNSSPEKMRAARDRGDDERMVTFESEHKMESIALSEDESSDGIHIDEDQENFRAFINRGDVDEVSQSPSSPTPNVKRQSVQNRRLSMSPQKQLLESSWVRQSKRVIIVERSALSCITIFAKNLMEQGNMTEWEYSLLQRFYSMIAWEPAHILYLRVDPEVCCKRISQRNRKGEEDVDPDLIHGLHEKHEHMFVREEQDGVGCQDGICASPSQNIIIVNGHYKSDSVLKEALHKISKIEARYD